MLLTATSIRFSPDGFKRFYDGWERYAGKVLLRSQQVSNPLEIIRHLEVIGMNTLVEVDIYALANSTCVMGSRMLNGLGGSADSCAVLNTPSCILRAPGLAKQTQQGSAVLYVCAPTWIRLSTILT